MGERKRVLCRALMLPDGTVSIVGATENVVKTWSDYGGSLSSALDNAAWEQAYSATEDGETSATIVDVWVTLELPQVVPGKLVEVSCG